MKQRFAEHDILRSMPRVIEVCARCSRGILTFLGPGDGHPNERARNPLGESWCYVCGESRETGLRYARCDDDGR